jgi:hypothetical protein
MLFFSIAAPNKAVIAVKQSYRLPIAKLLVIYAIQKNKDPDPATFENLIKGSSNVSRTKK